MSANILIEASRHELGTHVQKAVYIEIFRKDIQPVIQAVPLLPHIIVKVRERMAVCLIFIILTDNLSKGNNLFSVFHNAFGTPELQHQINERLYFLVIRLYTARIKRIYTQWRSTVIINVQRLIFI